jgi:hypothetical protein
VNIPKETRRESYDAILQDVETRRRIVYEILQERGRLTAQEAATELHRRGLIPSDGRNFAAPRLTELKKAGKVEPVGKKTPVPKLAVASPSGRLKGAWSNGICTRPQGLNPCKDQNSVQPYQAAAPLFWNSGGARCSGLLPAQRGDGRTGRGYCHGAAHAPLFFVRHV